MSELWFYGQQGTQRGPVEIEALRTLAASGELHPTDLVWREGMADWVPASTVPDLFAAVPPPSSPPLSPPPPPRPSPQPAAVHPVLYDVPDQSGRATGALVLGILSLAGCMCPFVGMLIGAAAVATGLGVKNPRNRALALTGVVCGIMGIMLGLSAMGGFHRLRL